MAKDVKSIDAEKHDQFIRNALFTARYGAIPVSFSFLLADYIYYNSHFFYFLGFRFFCLILLLLALHFVEHSKNYFEAQVFTALGFCSLALPIYLMIFWSKDYDSVYVDGLNIILIALNFGFRFSRKFYVGILALTIGPYILLNLIVGTPIGAESKFLLEVMVSSSFIFLGLLSRFLFEHLHLTEYGT